MKPDNAPYSEDMSDDTQDTNGMNWPRGDTPVEEIADDMLVDAMLMGRLRDTPEATAKRVDCVCRTFTRSAIVRSWPWKTGFSTAAAAAVIIVALVLLFSSPTSVQADFNQVLQAFDAGAKTYMIDITQETNSSPPVPRGGPRRIGRGRQAALRPRRGGQPAERLDGAMLYIEGRKHVLTFKTRSGLTVARGFDGTQAWLAHPWRRLPPSNDPNVLLPEIPRDVVELLFVDLRDTLGQVQKNYRLFEAPQEGDTPLIHLVATRRTPRMRLPRRIDLWVDPETNLLQEILCEGIGPRNPGPRYTLKISLVSTAPLPADWFTEQAHRFDSQEM